jgi:hypothetical protein
MGMFDLTATTGVKESGKYLQPGIHNAKFVGIELNDLVSQKNSQNYKTMKLTLDIDGFGEFNHNFFEPTSDKRTPGTWAENPSPVEQFMVAVRQIVDALDSKIGAAIDADNIEINGKHINLKDLNFDQLVKLIAILTKPYAGKELEVKLIPQSNGFADIPGFPAKCDRNGKLAIQTKFIGANLIINQSEQRKIDAAKNAQPTNMSQTTSGSVEGLAEQLGIEDTSSDLPF